ncbi:MAG: hypothetical protein Q8Q09_25780 [Deltaproteobacteria bacterium]|nr:hypothetical protein [Deltaproteobacteria bacterium]
MKWTWGYGVSLAVMGIGCEPPMPMTPDARVVIDGGSEAAVMRGPPAPAVGNGQRCALSADCPTGTFCDLGECVQQCNLRDPCTGALTCTPRGRCADPDSGVASDPPVAPAIGVLSATPSSVSLTDQGQFSLELRGSGRVRYRVDALPSWVRIASIRGEFSDSTMLTFTVDAAMRPLGATNARISVISSQGRAEVSVTSQADFTGVYSGVVTYTGVRLNAGAAEIPIALGSTRVGIDLRQDRSVIQGRVDPERSLLWPASQGSTSGPAVGVGDVQMGRVSLRMRQLLDGRSTASLLSESPSVFDGRPIGRELQVELQRSAEGQVSGTVVERIVGLTGEPIEVLGTIALTRNTEQRVPEFAVGSVPTLPAGPSRSTGALPRLCDPDAFGVASYATPGGLVAVPYDCRPSATLGQRRECMKRYFWDGFALHRFHGANASVEGSSSFVLPRTPSMMSTMPPYGVLAPPCIAQLQSTTLREDFAQVAPVPPMGQQCVAAAAVQCARYVGAARFAASDPERGQAAHDAARVWGELFGLLGNESMVQAWRDSFDATDPSGRMRRAFVEARRRYDAGLFRIFDAATFEELRAISAANATGRPTYFDASVGANDRIALRRASDLLRGSLRATSEMIDIDRGAAGMRETLRSNVPRDAVLLWIQVALLADLDARWRGGNPALPEVIQLGSALESLDRSVRSLADDSNPLGVADNSVPLFSRPGGETGTNFDLARAVAANTLMNALATDQRARTAVRQFDAAEDQVTSAQRDVRLRYRSELRALCGNDYAPEGSDLVLDLDRCGSSAGNVRALVLAYRAALARLEGAQGALRSHQARIENQRFTMVTVRGIREDQIRFTRDSQEQIWWLQLGIETLNVATEVIRIASQASVANLGTPGFLAPVVGVLQGLASAGRLTQQRIQNAVEMNALVGSANETFVRDMAALKDLIIQRAQLEHQIVLDATDVARAMVDLGNAREQVVRLVADFNQETANASRRFVNDPAFRIERDVAAITARTDFSAARLRVYEAARALEYETNKRLPSVLDAIVGTQNAQQLERVFNCVTGGWDSWRRLVTTPNMYMREVSVRRDILGIVASRTDAETGEVISEGEQFRRALLAQPVSNEGRTWPAIRFATSLRRDSALFTSLVCNARITSLQARVVGDFLGDNQAILRLLADGAGSVRTCDSGASNTLTNEWKLRPAGVLAPATLAAGVNDFGTPEVSLLYYPVAQSSWVLAVPTEEPENRDLDVRRIDDIVLRFNYSAIASGGGAASFSLTCN